MNIVICIYICDKRKHATDRNSPENKAIDTIKQDLQLKILLDLSVWLNLRLKIP